MNSIKIICYQLPKSELYFFNTFDFGDLNIQIIGIFDEVPEFVSKISSSSPNIILINSLTSTSDLYYLINEIKKVAPNAIRILFSTIYSKFIIDEVLELGIHRVIHKSIKGKYLVNEILLLLNDHSGKFSSNITPA